MHEEFIALRKAIIEKEFVRMNDMQRKAVFQTEGPLLILAGAGSGKTTVLVNRIANIVKYGNAYHSVHVPPDVTTDDIDMLKACLDGSREADDKIVSRLAVSKTPAWKVLAITFTNKAAGELKERLETLLGAVGSDVWASTFHASCARMLRRDADRLGYSGRFTIYDTADSRRLMKDCMKSLNMDEKMFPHRSILSEISRAKDELLSPGAYAEKAASDYRLKKIAEAYALYQKRLKEADAMDFDDLIMRTVLLLQQNEDVLQYYHNRFNYILVDEYQDTNHAQYCLVSLLAKGKRNFCVVGDDDQSIYRFRGATIDNIMSFEKQYPDATVIRLEQNYRSAGRILEAANAVISNNKMRKGKKLWTANETGEKIILYTAQNEQDEAKYIADTILDNVRQGAKYADHAVLYRLNAQASSIEQALVKSGVPYRILAGMRFFEHKEIKDMIAYLSVIANPDDSVRLQRIINEPKRAIGATTLAKAMEIADGLNISLYEVLQTADQYAPLARAASKLASFCQMMNIIIGKAEELSLHELYEWALDQTGYMAMLKGGGPEDEPRIDNVNELSSIILTYEQGNDEPTLSGFLEEISLMTDVDNYDREADAVILMTLHSAKGLEFPHVFIPGMEEQVFPGIKSMFDPVEVEEERRLAYVGITRARKQLYITKCESRLLYGTTSRNMQSRFVAEIPSAVIRPERSRFLGPEKKPLPKKTPTEADRARAVTTAAARKFGVSSGAPSGSGASCTLQPGDTVFHKTFGNGMVISVKPMGNDHLIEIAFERVGTKKIMANFAKLQKV